MEEMGREISLLSLTVAGWLMVGLFFKAQGLAPGHVPFKNRKTAFANFQTATRYKPMCDDRNSFKEKLKSWLMWWARMSTVINHNACVRTRVCEQCIFYLVRGLCLSVFLFTLSAVLQLAAITPYFTPLLILSVKNTRHLHLIYTSKGPQAGGGLPTSIKYFSLSLFVFSRTAAGLTRPLLSYQQCTKFTLNIFNTLSFAQLTQWIQHISVAAAPITRDLLSGYLHNPHGSTQQPPGGTASCGEHLFNLSSSYNEYLVTQWL